MNKNIYILQHIHENQLYILFYPMQLQGHVVKKCSPWLTSSAEEAESLLSVPSLRVDEASVGAGTVAWLTLAAVLSNSTVVASLSLAELLANSTNVALQGRL